MICHSRTRLALAAGAALWTAASTPPAHALDVANGDVVGMFQKNGFEVVVNLGDVGTLTPGSMFDLAGVVDIPEFGGSMADVKFVALGVEDPGRTTGDFGFGPLPQPDIIYSTRVEFPDPDDGEIELASAQLDAPLPGSSPWFELLRQLGSGTEDVIMTDETFSYEQKIGKGTDRVGNTLPFSVAGTFDASQELSITVHQAVRGYEAFGGPATQRTPLVQLDFSGTMVDAVEVPEPSDLVLLVAGALLLRPFARSAGARV